MARYISPTTLVVVLLAMLSCIIEASRLNEFIHDANKPSASTDKPVGKKWAVLLAGSKGYKNYDQQANVCHAYHVLKRGGFKDENIVVFMYDDIANNRYNPKPGRLFNNPVGYDVYHGVPKDYTGDDVNVQNFFAVILGNKTGLTGGSGKVVDSGPDDHIFIYYTDHGSSGLLCMPNDKYLYANDLMEVLQKKHDAKAYQRMVIYIEACESGSMFEGILPENLNIYAMTSSNAYELSYMAYCPGEYYPDVASEYGICFGGLFSISWMEDSDGHDLRTECLEQQYQRVKRRTRYELLSHGYSSHVSRYGSMEIAGDSLFSYFGASDGNNSNSIVNQNNDLKRPSSSMPTKKPVSIRDTDLYHFSHKFHNAAEGSAEKAEALKQLNEERAHRKNVDQKMNRIAKLLLGSENSLAELQAIVRPQGQPLLDDWDCFKSLVNIYVEKCGTLSAYGRKYTRAIANMCNAKIKPEQMAMVSAQACGRT